MDLADHLPDATMSPMAGRRALATFLAAAAIAEAIAIVSLSSIGDPRFQIQADLPSVGFLATIVLFPLVGALILRRRPMTGVAWLMCLMGVGIGAGLVLFAYAVAATPPHPSGPFATEAAVLSSLFFEPSLALGGALMLLLFPTDRLPSPRWRWVAAVAVVGSLLFDLGQVVQSGELDPASFPGMRSPLALPPDLDWVARLLIGLGNGAAVAGALGAVVSLLLRYRRADATEAAQLKWIVLAGSVSVVFLAISALQLGPLSDLAFGVGLVLFSGVPIAIGIAITRYRLYEIDRLINRAIVYGALTAILAGVFTAAVGLAQRIFIDLTGQTSDAAIVLTTLVVATLYAPLRKRLESVVDRYFKYDTRRFGAYAAEVRGVLDVIEPRRAAARLAAEAVDELDVTGAAVIGPDGTVLASAGVWPAAAWREVVVAAGGPFAIVRLGPRARGGELDEGALAELGEVAGLVGSGVRLTA